MSACYCVNTAKETGKKITVTMWYQLTFKFFFGMEKKRMFFSVKVQTVPILFSVIFKSPVSLYPFLVASMF